MSECAIEGQAAPGGGDGGEPSLDGAFAADGTDLTLIRWMLRLSPAERLQALQSMVDLVADVRTRDAD